MARKRIDIAVTAPGMLSSDYYAVARDQSGREIAYAYGRDQHDATAKCVQKVRAIYGGDAEILY